MTLKRTKSILVGMIGIDYTTLNKTSPGNVGRFVLAATCVLLILALSSVSVYYAFELMFHIWYVQVLLSLFFSLMFGVIYILLIQTFSKQPLAQKTRNRLNVSNMLRGGFIFFIGFLIAQPLAIMVLSTRLDGDIDLYRVKQKTSFENQMHVIYASDIRKLKSRLHTYEQIGLTNWHDDVHATIKQLEVLEDKERTAIEKANSRIDGSAFFLQRIRLSTSRYPVSWFVCILIVMLFFIPAVLVYTVSSNNIYYVDKQVKEHALVSSHYLQFTRLYTKAFEEGFGLQSINFYEIHTDPPFRTQRIPAPECSTEKEFFNRFKGNGLPQRLL